MYRFLHNSAAGIYSVTEPIFLKVFFFLPFLSLSRSQFFHQAISMFLRYLAGFPSLSHHHLDLDDDHVTTVIIEELTERGRKNEVYTAAQTYVFSKLNLNRYVGECKFEDLYQGVELKWRVFVEKKNTKESFELRFDEQHKDLVLDSYIPFVESKANEMKMKNKILQMHTYSPCSDTWETKSLHLHHSTFGTIVMKEKLKRDLDQFMGRKDFYIKVGRNWMRNYLLHGPGKTSLVAAMAKYLNFDVYNINLKGAKADFDPRRVILGLMGSSILLVEDIDQGSSVVLSQLLSCLAGFWSSGEPRVVIFTTDNKERLEPTLLRRMDMEIYMGHCCFEGFKTLASFYLGLSQEIDCPHHLYPDIKRLLDGQALVTPGQVAEELMKSQDVDVALEGLVKTLEMKSV